MQQGCAVHIRFIVVNNIVQHCFTGLRADSGSTMLNNIVDNYEPDMGSTALLHPVFNNLEQVIIFRRVLHDSASG